MLSSYRLGDLVLLTLKIEEKMEILHDYPDSLGSQYIIKNQYFKNEMNIDLITELVLTTIKKYEPVLPKDIETSTAIHLRLGDVVMGTHDHEKEKRPLSISHLKSKINNNDKKYIIGKPFFCKESSTNYEECIRESNNYLQNVMQEFGATHFSGDNADIDLCCAVQSKTFIQGPGYFSLLISEIRKKLKKHTIELYNKNVVVFNRGDCHGLFSCCSLRLHDIINYVNKHHFLPVVVDNSKMLLLYKDVDETDITFDYFTHYDELDMSEMNKYYDRFVDYNEGYENIRFEHLNFESLQPFVKKYFTPSRNIQQKINFIEEKYNLVYENICVLFYRGNDKGREITLPSYDEYVLVANNIIEKHPNVRLLIQSDQTEFIEFMTEKYPQAFYFKDEIRHIKKCDSTVDKELRKDIKLFSYYYLAITIIMSKCKFVVCGSGNCSIWIALFRGNMDNFFQLYKDHIVKLKDYHNKKEKPVVENNVSHSSNMNSKNNTIHNKKRLFLM